MAAASSSSSSNPTMQWKYNVFLSFRGEDTRNNFTSHLYAALRDKAIETFIDNDEFEKGEEISPALLKAIEESKISIIVLSENYASSSWCLDELLKILECKITNGQLVVPVFYRVDPSHVRNQIGSFAEAFAKHESKGKLDKVHKWRAALTDVANLTGHTWQQNRSESMLIDEIIEDVLDKLNNISRSDHFEGLVGIDSHIEQIESLLCIGLKSANIVVGIWGMGGIGKTTIATTIFNRISSQFDGCCCLKNVREVSEKHGVVYLKKELLGKILKDKNIKRGTVDLENPFICERLGRKRVLIVLDDVNDSSQLESIIGRFDRFGKGSRIIITTRNKQVLKKGVDEIYEVTKLNYHEALRLFRLNAFKQNDPIEEFMELSEKVVNYAKGLPLALKVLGSFLFGRSKREWESALDKLKETPNMEIQRVLRISYDDLDQKEKNILCDIACFFNGEDKDHVVVILDGCGLFAEIGINVLIEKSLITISNHKLCMHDLLQEMCWEIVHEVSEEPGERSRLWNHKDVCHVLTNKTGTKAVKGIFLDLSNISEVYLSSKAFKRMCNLRFLKFCYPLLSEAYEGFETRLSKAYGSSDNLPLLHFPEGLQSLSNMLSYLHWERYPLKSLPLNFHPENLVKLDLSFSKVEHLWEGTQPLFKLRKINLCDCKDLINIPDLSKAPNLECMILYGCESLLEVHSSSIHLSKLKELDLRRCKKLRSLPHYYSNELSLVSKRVSKRVSKKRLRLLSKLSSEPVPVPVLCESWDSAQLPMEELAPSISYFVGIFVQCLYTLRLDECNLSKIPDNLCNLSSLVELSLKGNNFVSIPASIKHLSELKCLDLSYCKRLQSLPELPSSIMEFWADGCISLRTISISSSISSISSIISSIRVINLSSALDDPVSMYFRYRNCLKLDQNSRSKIEANAQLKIELMATRVLKEKNYHEEYACSDLQPFHFLCPGNEIPEWFSYRSGGSLVTAQLPLHWGNSNFVGFVLCAVIALKDGYDDDNDAFNVDFKMKTYDGEYDLLSSYLETKRFESEHMVLWYESCFNVGKFEKDDWFHKYCYNEASFQFDAYNCRVEKCGVHLLYAEDEDESESECKSEEDEDESESECKSEDEDKSEIETVSWKPFRRIRSKRLKINKFIRGWI